MTVSAVSAACAAYDAFADFYATYWGPVLRDHALRAIDELLLPRLREAGGDGLPAGWSQRPKESQTGSPPPLNAAQADLSPPLNEAQADSSPPLNEAQADLSRRPQAAQPGPLDLEDLRILDLCCGSGDLAAVLAARGYDVLGLDGSPRMLDRAQIAAPGARFRLADARTFVVEQPFDAVLCMYDSLNHLASLDELRQTFSQVYAALKPGGMFLFDLNTRDGFEVRFQGSFGFAEADRSLLVRATFDDQEDIGRYALTLFRRQVEDRLNSLDASHWIRTDAMLEQRCFEEHQVRAALAEAGFDAASVFDAEAALGMDGHVGRAMFVARHSG